MRFLFDLNHPAHVHYFRNLITILESEGHEVLVTCIQKDVLVDLLKHYNIKYKIIGSHQPQLIQKIKNVPIFDLKLYKVAKIFNPDFFLGFASYRAAHISYILGKKCILFDDTDYAVFEQLLYRPFNPIIVTPDWFRKDFGKRHIKFPGNIELAYLHPRFFTPNPSVLDYINSNMDERIILIRLVSWGASHDIGQGGIQDLSSLVEEISQYGRIIINSERKLPDDLQKYDIKIPPHMFHDLLFYSTIYIGEGATTATEAAILGTPAIYINSLELPYLDENHYLNPFISWFPNRIDQNAILDHIKQKIYFSKDENSGKVIKSQSIERSLDVTNYMHSIIKLTKKDILT